MRHQHVAEYSLTEIFIGTEILGNEIGQRGIDFRGVHIIHALRDSVHIDPVVRDRIGQEFLETDCLLFRPCLIGKVRLVDGFLVENSCGGEHGIDNVGLIDLHLVGQIRIGSRVIPGQLIPDIREYGFCLSQECVINILLIR